jgi:hypothetical protein
LNLFERGRSEAHLENGRAHARAKDIGGATTEVQIEGGERDID